MTFCTKTPDKKHDFTRLIFLIKRSNIQYAFRIWKSLRAVYLIESYDLPIQGHLSPPVLDGA